MIFPAILLATALIGVNSFNLDLQHPLIYKSANLNTNFGYSTALRAGRLNITKSWLLVGAPRAKSSVRADGLLLVKDVGAVYKCYIKGNCTKIDFNYQDMVSGIEEHYQYELGSALLGSAIDVVSELYLICSPNWKVDFAIEKHDRMYGVCFYGDFEHKMEGFVMPLARLKGASKDQFVHNGTNWENYIWGQAGFSSHLSVDTNGAYQMLLGAPGVRSWKGAIVIYENMSVSDGGFSSNQNSNIKNAEENPLIIDPSSLEEFHRGLVGYAVTAGRYFARTELISVAGAPHANQSGQVYAYKTSSHKDDPKFTIEEDLIRDQQIGERFGSALATGDLNGDGRDDLLIGAPYFTSQKKPAQNEGRVFVYLGSPTGHFVAPKINDIIIGGAYNGLFGTTISCVGDLNKDEFHDFAIAAPFEGSGVVYIYRGSEDGLVLSQRIVASDLHRGLAGFGYSISRGQDIDNNGHNDIAIGAFKSGHAVIIRSKPVITLDASVTILGGNLRVNDTKFAAEVSIKYNDVTIVWTLDPGHHRIFIPGNSYDSENITLQVPSTGLDSQFEFFIKNNTRNFIEPIMLKAEFSLTPTNDTSVHPVIMSDVNKIDGEDKFCASCPVLISEKHLVVTESKEFLLNCKIENNCTANLTMRMRFLDANDSEVSKFVIGSLELLYLKVTLSNEGDPAYNPHVVITLPSMPRSLPTNCEKMANSLSVQVKCEAANPLRDGSHQSFRFEIETEKSTVNATILTASAQINTATRNVNLNSWSEISLPLSFEADVTVFGQVSKENYYFNSGLKNVNASVLLQVEKYGVSPLQEVVLKVDIPVGLSGANTFFVNLTEQKFQLNSKRLHCEPGPMAGLIHNQTAGSGSTHFQRQRNDTKTRNKRNASLLDRTKSDDFPTNTTLVIECSSREWQCAHLVCQTELLLSQIAATLELHLQINMNALESKLGTEKITVVLKLNAKVEISKPHGVVQPTIHKSDAVTVPIVLRRGVTDGSVEAWVIIVSAIAGIALFAIILVALQKLGFFKRPHKAHMQRLEKEHLPDAEVTTLGPMESIETSLVI